MKHEVPASETENVLSPPVTVEADGTNTTIHLGKKKGENPGGTTTSFSLIPVIVKQAYKIDPILTAIFNETGESHRNFNQRSYTGTT